MELLSDIGIFPCWFSGITVFQLGLLKFVSQDFIRQVTVKHFTKDLGKLRVLDTFANGILSLVFPLQLQQCFIF